MFFRSVLRRSSIVVAIFFITFLLIGIFFYRDYGLSFDEPIQRFIGGVNLSYVLHGDKKLFEYTESLYGPIFEIALIVLEKVFALNDTREIYFMRHLVTFLTFYAGTIAFYFLGKKFFQRTSTAFLATIALIISPRIFENAFYNTKDIPCLVCFVLSNLTLFLYLEKPTLWSLVRHAATCAILITVRISGLLVFVLTIYFLALELLERKEKRLANNLFVSLKLLLFVIVSGLFVFVSWPILWTNTLIHLGQVIAIMSHYPWLHTVRFIGQDLPSNSLPWFYIPVWILISTPMIYSALFIPSTVWISVDLVSHWNNFSEYTKKKRLAVLGWFFGPLFMVIFMHSTLYDSWRHMFFIYPAFLLLAFWGWEKIWELAKYRIGSIPVARYILAAALGLAFVFTAGTMIHLHPYEQLYFNRLAGKNLEEIKTRFDLDYWGLSYRKGLEFLSRYDPGSEIRVAVETEAGIMNGFILPLADQSRFKFVERPSDATYYITNYRWERIVQYTDEVYSVMVDGIKILTVFKIQ